MYRNLKYLNNQYTFSYIVKHLKYMILIMKNKYQFLKKNQNQNPHGCAGQALVIY